MQQPANISTKRLEIGLLSINSTVLLKCHKGALVADTFVSWCWTFPETLLAAVYRGALALSSQSNLPVCVRTCIYMAAVYRGALIHIYLHTDTQIDR